MASRPLVLAIFVLSGAAGLIYEIVWSRQLVLVFGNTTQAVSAILTGFFGGMAIGAAIGGRIADRVRSPLRLYGLLEASTRPSRGRHSSRSRGSSWPCSPLGPRPS
jgi:spermidine synthase